MKIFDSDICFICTHLAAHKNNCQGRNQDYAKILELLKFQRNENDPNINDPYCEPFDILRHHDYVIWLGDLNYRLNLDDLELVYNKIEEQDWKYLLQHDQLNQERRAQNAFKLFEEDEILFAPTYKFQPNTNIYEKRPDKKTTYAIMV